METIGTRIKQVRGSLTQAEFAKELGSFTQSDVSNYETNRLEPSFEFLIALARCFSVDLHWVLTGDVRGKVKEGSAPYFTRADVQQIAQDLLTRPRLLKLIEKMIQADEKLSRDADALARSLGASREKAYLMLMLQKEEL